MKKILFLAVLLSGCHSLDRITGGSDWTGQRDEVYVLGGQSLMAGSDTPSYPDQPNVKEYFNKPWAPMSGEGIAFAIERANQGHNVIVIQCAEGGTSMAQWEPPNGPLYKQCVDYIGQLGKPVTAVLFDQGQNDADPAPTTPSWKTSFENMVNGFRSFTHNSDLPVIFVRIGTNKWGLDPYHDWVLSEQNAVNMPNVKMVINDVPPIGGYHLGPDGYKEIGRRILAAVWW